MGTTERLRQDFVWRFIVYMTLAVIDLSWTMFAGKDLNWDALNYHLYSGFSALNRRSELDYFAAGPQSYLNPYAHIPLYLMVSAGWPSLAIGAVLACLHTVNLWLSYELATTLNERTDGSVSRSTVLLAVVLALLNPVFLQETGSSYADITTSIPIMGGYLLLARNFFTPSQSRLALSGVLLGTGAALKLSNAIYVIAALPAVLFLSKPLVWRARSFIVLGLGSMLGFALVSGPWAWQMWKIFGNPFFPLFNQIFHSPFFTTEPIKDYRFLPVSLLDALVRPFKMALPLSKIHVEVRAPDIRYAALVLLLPIWLALAWCRNRKRAGNEISLRTSPFSENSNRALVGLIIAFAVAWMLWLKMSGNSRYFLPMACVAGIVLASVLARLFVYNERGLFYATVLILGSQILQTYIATTERWGGSAKWDGQWYQVSVPDRFKAEPNLYFSTDSPSGSFFLPFLAPGSGMINSAGQIVLAGDGAMAEPIYRLIERNSGHIRMLSRISSLHSDGSPILYPPEGLDQLVLRFGLRIDPADCAIFSIHGGPTPMVIPDRSESHVDVSAALAKGLTYFQSCRLVPANSEAVKSFREEQKDVDQIFDHIEESCPQLFQPRHINAQKWGSSWRRYYANTDIEVVIHDGTVAFLDVFRRGDPIVIGSEEDWKHGPQPMNCLKKYAPFLSEPSAIHTMNPSK